MKKDKKIIDGEGNYITTQKFGNIISLSLKLQSENYSRKIGIIDVSSKTLFIERKRSKHLFRKLNAYGICYKILKDGKTFDTIRLSDDYEEWIIPKDFFLEESKQLHFIGNGGFELQAFIPLESIEQFKIK